MIRIENLKYKYPTGTFRLDVSRFTVERQETVALIGPSGSGKTTLLHLIAGILLPSMGQVTTNGIEITKLSDAARRQFRIQHVGLAFQEFELLEHLNVLDNVLLPCRITPVLPLTEKTRQRALQLTREMGIGDKVQRYVRHLSQGERQRVAVCRALLSSPPLLLCDEPTGNLDPLNKQHVMDVLFDYVTKNATTLLVVTHDRDLLPRFDRTLDVKTFHPNSEGT